MKEQPDQSCTGGDTRGSSGHRKEERETRQGGRNVDLFKVMFGRFV